MKAKVKGYGVIEQFLKDGTEVFYPVVVTEETTGFFKKETRDMKYTFHNGKPAFYWRHEIPGAAESFDTKQEAEEFLKKFINPIKTHSPVFHPYSSCDVYTPGEGPCNASNK